MKARAEVGDEKAKAELTAYKQYQVKASIKCYRKMRENALNGDLEAKVRYERTLAQRRAAYQAKKAGQTA